MNAPEQSAFPIQIQMVGGTGIELGMTKRELIATLYMASCNIYVGNHKDAQRAAYVSMMAADALIEAFEKAKDGRGSYG